jgi:hypothetical protein
LNLVEQNKLSPLLTSAGLAAIAMIAGSYFFLSVVIASDVPQGDHWSWLHELLMPYLKGEISIGEYLTGPFKR